MDESDVGYIDNDCIVNTDGYCQLTTFNGLDLHECRISHIEYEIEDRDDNYL